MNALLARIIGPNKKSTPIRITFYSRANCSCCEKAMNVLRSFRKRYLFSIETIDIDADCDLRAKYDLTVPVVSINGRERFRGLINPALLERVLWSESREA
jgi:glutaredoxin